MMRELAWTTSSADSVAETTAVPAPSGHERCSVRAYLVSRRGRHQHQIEVRSLESGPFGRPPAAAIVAPAPIDRFGRYWVFFGAVPKTWSQNGALTPYPRSWFWK
jgi:hypothetical protein